MMGMQLPTSGPIVMRDTWNVTQFVLIIPALFCFKSYMYSKQLRPCLHAHIPTKKLLYLRKLEFFSYK